MADRLGDRIRQARERYGMSQTELARRVKVSKQTIWEIESNRTPDPGVRKVQAIAKILQVSMDSLLDVAGDLLSESMPASLELVDASHQAGSRPPSK